MRRETVTPTDEGSKSAEANDNSGGFNRRRFVEMAVATVAASAAISSPANAQQESLASSQPSSLPAPSDSTSDILVETMLDWGVTHVFGIVGDGINPIIEALRKRRDRIAFVSVRHEEAAAFMASAYAKYSGRLGVCIATTGPGAVHLMNGLYDAMYDNAPVLAITGSTFRDLEGMRFMQGVDTVKLMESVTLYNEQVNGPHHAILMVNRAIRGALGVAHLTLPKDVQTMTLSADKASMENHGGRTASSWSPPMGTPPGDQLRAAAAILNAGKRVAILAGSGCFPARAELRQVAELLGAPIAKAYLAKALLADDDPLTTGGVGHLGTQPSSWSMHGCDTVLILGCMMPWIDYYPKPGQARGVQIDIKSDHIGLKYAVEIGLTGDVKATLAALLPLLQKNSDRSFLTEAQRRMRDWNSLLGRVAATQKRAKLRPQSVARMLGEMAPADAVFSMDAGGNTHFAARFISIKEGQRWSGVGTLGSMASGIPYAIAASFVFPDRPVIAVAGDGGFAMLMAELSTAVFYNRNIKLIVFNNDAFGEVKFEQREIGNPEYGTAIGHIDFAKFAEAVGAKSFRASSLVALKPAMQAWLTTPGVALLDVQVDADEEASAPDKLSA